MKITQSQLRQIIKEELEAVMGESFKDLMKTAAKSFRPMQSDAEWEAKREAEIAARLQKLDDEEEMKRQEQAQIDAYREEARLRDAATEAQRDRWAQRTKHRRRWRGVQEKKQK